VLRRLHPIAGIIGFLTILAFWTSTVAVELFGSHEAITIVKQAIPWGFIVLIPALALTGASGLSIAKRGTDARVTAKKKRMPFIAGNGLLVLVPSAFYLSSATFTTGFYVVQAIELIAGAVNLTLMALSMRDGFQLSGRLRKPVRA
jgi:hypothetical protein